MTIANLTIEPGMILADVRRVEADRLAAFIIERAARIVRETRADRGDWDDSGDWLIDAVELAHAIVRREANNLIRWSRLEHFAIPPREDHLVSVEYDPIDLRRGGTTRRAECTCGWRGPERGTFTLAADDAATHETSNTKGTEP